MAFFSFCLPNASSYRSRSCFFLPVDSLTIPIFSFDRSREKRILSMINNVDIRSFLSFYIYKKKGPKEGKKPGKDEVDFLALFFSQLVSSSNIPVLYRHHGREIFFSFLSSFQALTEQERKKRIRPRYIISDKSLIEKSQLKDVYLLKDFFRNENLHSQARLPLLNRKSCDVISSSSREFPSNIFVIHSSTFSNSSPLDSIDFDCHINSSNSHSHFYQSICDWITSTTRNSD